ncbi:MAG: PQQ-binding-like beta-propeller repeat protein [Bacteroidetes bacterium]|jgi:hypothetical protein|nr:PQQ-binding-like beta-propeller repeat protein [Bacteroidota bacterium]
MIDRLNGHIKNSTLLFIALILCLGCFSPKSDELSTSIVKYTSHRLDLKKIIAPNYISVREKIKNGKILINATNKADSSFFIVVDINSQQIDQIIKDPFNDYKSTYFDINNQFIFCCDVSSSPCKIFIRGLKDEKRFHLLHSSLVGQSIISVTNVQLFLINNVYGVGVIDIQHQTPLFFQNPAGKSTPPLASTVSFPLSNSLNLVSGHSTTDSTINLYAINNNQKILWKNSVKRPKENSQIRILSAGSVFIMANAKMLIALSKKNGSLIWSKSFDNDINEIKNIDGKIVVCTFNPGSYFPKENESYQIILKLLNSNDGNIVWEKRFNSQGKPNLAICNTNLFIADNENFEVFNVRSGQLSHHSSNSEKERPKYYFNTSTDLATGENYLKFDDQYYW